MENSTENKLKLFKWIAFLGWTLAIILFLNDVDSKQHIEIKKSLDIDNMTKEQLIRARDSIYNLYRALP